MNIDAGTIGIVLSLVGTGASIVWFASKVTTTVDVHGNAIGELKRKQDAHERAITDHHGRLSTLEGKGTGK